MSLERLRAAYPRYMALVDPGEDDQVVEGLMLAVERILERLDGADAREASPSEIEAMRRMDGT